MFTTGLNPLLMSITRSVLSALPVITENKTKKWGNCFTKNHQILLNSEELVITHSWEIRCKSIDSSSMELFTKNNFIRPHVLEIHKSIIRARCYDIIIGISTVTVEDNLCNCSFVQASWFHSCTWVYVLSNKEDYDKTTFFFVNSIVSFSFGLTQIATVPYLSPLTTRELFHAKSSTASLCGPNSLAAWDLLWRSLEEKITKKCIKKYYKMCLNMNDIYHMPKVAS